MGKVWGWIGHRFGLDGAHHTLLDRRVPHTPWYYGDGMTLLTLLGVQIVTGMILSLSYSASPETAYDSVLYITHEQWMGWFVRGMHYWGAGLMVVMVLFHVFRLILVGGYKFPREGTWLVGTGLFFLVQTMALTGYMLRGDERALFAYRVVANGLLNVPWIGEELVLLVQGGHDFGARTLARIFGVHAVIVPMLLLVGVAFHVTLIVLRGVTSPAERRQAIHSVEQHEQVYKAASESDEEGETFWPETAAAGTLMGFLVFVLVVALTLVLGPGALYPKWNLVHRSLPAEEWWFWWYSGMAALLPPSWAPVVYVGLPLAILVAMVALPFVDRGPWRGIRRRPGAVVFVVVAVASLLYLSDYRRRSPFMGWPRLDPPEVPEGVALASEEEQGRQLFATYGCNSCHPVAGRGPQHFGPDLGRPSEPRSYEGMRAFVLRPPPESPMPAYEGTITDEDLDLVIRYVLAAQTFPRWQR